MERASWQGIAWPGGLRGGLGPGPEPLWYWVISQSLTPFYILHHGNGNREKQQRRQCGAHEGIPVV